MEALMEAGKVSNVVRAKLEFSRCPMSMRMLMECVELQRVKEHQIKFQLDKLKREGLVRAVPINVPNSNDRVGFEWVKDGEKITLPPPIKKAIDEVRLKINDDHSVTITTPKIRVTIEVPL